MTNGMSVIEWLSIGNLILNTLILPIAFFAWRMAKAMVKVEQIIVDHARRIDRVEGSIDDAARDGRIDRRKGR